MVWYPIPLFSLLFIFFKLLFISQSVFRSIDYPFSYLLAWRGVGTCIPLTFRTSCFVPFSKICSSFLLISRIGGRKKREVEKSANEHIRGQEGWSDPLLWPNIWSGERTDSVEEKPELRPEVSYLSFFSNIMKTWTLNQHVYEYIFLCQVDSYFVKYIYMYKLSLDCYSAKGLRKDIGRYCM